ncbi:MAG: hypothetical protein ACRCW9_06215 [Cetobacterium sp.]
MEKIGYIKKENRSKSKVPIGFTKEEFENQIPIIYLEAKLNNIWDINYIVVKDLNSKSSFIINDEYLFQNRTENKTEYRIDEDKNIIISGYFEVTNQAEGNLPYLTAVESITELKEKPYFFSTEFERIFKLRKYRKELKWYKQKNIDNKLINEIFSIKKIDGRNFTKYLTFYNEDLILKTIRIKSFDELLKNSEEYIFEE